MTQVEVDILLVEDNPADVELILHSLSKENLANHVEVARDGEEALDYLFCRGQHKTRSPENPPRLILLDLKLPKVDGLEVLQQIKNDPRTKAIPVVILTSSKEGSDLAAGYRYGVNSYIQKPMDFNDFRKCVRELGLYWLLVNQPPPRAAFPAGKKG